MKKVLYLLLLFVLCAFQCEEEVENDQRSSVSGLIVDGNNNPLSDIKIQVISEDLVLGESRSESNGFFSFTSLRPGYDHFRIAINRTEGSPYSRVTYVYGDSSFEERYNLDQVVLRKLATLDFKITKTSPDQNVLDFSLEYISSECSFFFIDTNIPNSEDCYEDKIISGTLDNQTNFESEVPSLLYSSVRFSYELNNEPPQTILIELTEATTTYEFEY